MQCERIAYDRVSQSSANGYIYLFRKGEYINIYIFRKGECDWQQRTVNFARNLGEINYYQLFAEIMWMICNHVIHKK